MRGSTESRRALSLPAELTRSAPRDVALTTGGRALTLVGWLLAFGALAASAALYLEAQRQSNAALDFDRRSVTTTAVVDRVWRKSGDGKPAFAAFHFDVNGTRIDADSRMQLDAWRELRAGSTLPVRYLPDNPRRFVAAGQRRNGRMPSAVPYVAFTVLAAAAFLCFATVRWQRFLLSEGRAAGAVVTAVKKSKGSSGETHREMVYEFPVLAGTMATGKAAAGKTQDVGSRISVVYDPERPHRNRPYPFSLVTLNREW
jgi:hypothetical protein